MAKFIGSSKNVAVDSKGRITLPSLMRKALPPDAHDALIITRGFDGCLTGFTLDGFDRRLEELQQFSRSDLQRRQFTQVMVSLASQTEIDKQGRIHIPRELLDMANIKDRVTIVGDIDQIQFWNPDRYEAFFKEAYENYDQIGQSLRIG